MDIPRTAGVEAFILFLKRKIHIIVYAQDAVTSLQPRERISLFWTRLSIGRMLISRWGTFLTQRLAVLFVTILDMLKTEHPVFTRERYSQQRILSPKQQIGLHIGCLLR